MKVLVTGAAGFIGFHLSRNLLNRGDTVIGLDNLTPYYDVELKKARLSLLKDCRDFSFRQLDLCRSDDIMELFASERIDRVVHLAAQAGVRYSLTHPHVYTEANVEGFLNILEACRKYPVSHLVYASSSSVYGANRKLPFSVDDTVDHPVSLYAATKKANELMAHSYSHLYGLPTTGLRFFTVYGPWGRPDMAFFIFTKQILAGEPLPLFNHGKHRRDFTYIDDIVEGVTRVLDRPASSDSDWNAESPRTGSSAAPYRIYNIGNNSPVWLSEVIGALEESLGKKAILEPHAKQPGDVIETYADITPLIKDFGFRPCVEIHEGARRFVNWYRDYYQV